MNDDELTQVLDAIDEVAAKSVEEMHRVREETLTGYPVDARAVASAKRIVRRLRWAIKPTCSHSVNTGGIILTWTFQSETRGCDIATIFVGAEGRAALNRPKKFMKSGKEHHENNADQIRDRRSI